jgi:GNAT superfamily N-acetyltransferase
LWFKLLSCVILSLSPAQPDDIREIQQIYIDFRRPPRAKLQIEHYPVARESAHLAGCAVRKECQRRGIGRALTEPPRPGETYALPVMAIMSQAPGGASREAQFRTLFPNLRYEGWQGSGHFPMMERPERFNRALEEFLGSLP